MAVNKSQHQIIVDAVSNLIVAMLAEADSNIEMENSVIGLEPATLFKNEEMDRYAWVCVHPGTESPQVFLATRDECEYINAPVCDWFNSDEGPQIFSPRFSNENKGDGVVYGYNVFYGRDDPYNKNFASAVSQAAKYIVTWLVMGKRDY